MAPCRVFCTERDIEVNLLWRISHVYAIVVFGVAASSDAVGSECDVGEVIRGIVGSHAEISDSFRPTQITLSFVECVSPGKERVTRSTDYRFHGKNVLVMNDLELWAMNTDYEFHLRREASESAWSIKDVAMVTGDEMLSSTRVTLSLAHDTFKKVLIANHIPIAEMLTHPGSRVISCQESEEEGQRMVKIAVELDPAAKLQSGLEMRFSKCLLSFAPDSTGWIPLEIHMTGPNNDGLIYTHSRFEDLEGHLIPLQTKCVGKHPTGIEWERVNGSAEYRFDDVPKELFYLSHYGLPEPDLGARPRPYRLWFAILSAAVVIGLLATAVSRRRRPSTPVA